MNLSRLSDNDVLTDTKKWASVVRESLTTLLYHLREVERRKLFSVLKYESLFQYAVAELKFSEDEAGRRIAAMRLFGMCLR